MDRHSQSPRPAACTPSPAAWNSTHSAPPSRPSPCRFHNGRTEGANTKTKLIKRQMYGRADFTLLRHRILLT